MLAVNMCYLDLPVSHGITAESDTNLPVVTSVSTSCMSSATIPNSSLVCLPANYIGF